MHISMELKCNYSKIKEELKELHRLSPPTEVEISGYIDTLSRPLKTGQIGHTENTFLESRVEVPPIERIPFIDGRLQAGRGTAEPFDPPQLLLQWSRVRFRNSLNWSQ
jgi:hypothetical protein